MTMEPGRGAFFGRRKGKRLRKGQEDLVATLLPRLRVPQGEEVDPPALFVRSYGLRVVP